VGLSEASRARREAQHLTATEQTVLHRKKSCGSQATELEVWKAETPSARNLRHSSLYRIRLAL